MVRANLELANDASAYLPVVARAAATAGLSLPILPANTEYSYPAVARIGRGPIVSWQWRSDRALRLQGVSPGAVVLDSSSEEGRILATWNFKPTVLGYIPNLRGVVTGLSDTPGYSVSEPSTPRPISRGPAIVETAATRALRPFGVETDPLASLHSLLPSPLELVTPGTLQQRAKSDSTRPANQPRWAWNSVFLGCLTATLRKEPVGVTPDGLRIDWYVREGSFVGPQFQSVCLPGAADWMRIREDGVGVVNVQACFETPTGSRIYGTYGGIFDLGPDGFARAQREEFDPLPPVVVVPTYATADPALAWLNRAQCVGVGRVDMAALRVEFDVYVVRVGGAVQPAQGDASGDGRSAAQSESLYKRLGGYDQIAAITDDFVAAIVADKQLGRLFVSGFPESRLRTIRQHVVDMLCELTGGPCVYTGRDMVTTHKGLGITNSDWDISVNLLKATLNRYRVGAREQSELLRIIGDMKGMIVEKT
jgi:truncated hemoglobin YjbI